jgi:Bacterial Ig domain/Putative Ig domain
MRLNWHDIKPNPTVRVIPALNRELWRIIGQPNCFVEDITFQDTRIGDRWVEDFSDKNFSDLKYVRNLKMVSNGKVVATISALGTDSPPAITSSQVVAASRGMPFSYTITALNSPTSFNATNLPAGLSINTTTGVISGTPTTVGTNAITKSATNRFGTGTAPLTLRVNIPPTVVISSPTNGALFFVPTNIAAAATATDSDGTVSHVDFFVNGALRQTEFAAPHDFAWNAVPAGTYQLTARATDNDGATTMSAPVSITVESNEPVISSTTSANGTTNSPFTYTITASKTPTSFNATGLPVGLSVNTSTGVISGTPSSNGSTAVTISATNTHGTGSQTLTISITAGAATAAAPEAKPSSCGLGAISALILLMVFFGAFMVPIGRKKMLETVTIIRKKMKSGKK